MNKVKVRGLFFIIITLNLIFRVFAQNPKDSIDFNFENIPLDEILDSVSVITSYNFSYNSSILPRGSKFTYHDRNTISGLLDDLLVGTGISYAFSSRDQIILKQALSGNDKFSVMGLVKDENGEPLPGANVYLDGTVIGTSSDIDGSFQITNIPVGSYIIVFSFVGYETKAYRLNSYSSNEKMINVELSLKEYQLDSIQLFANAIRQEDPNRLTLARFRRDFLGYTINAYRCEIENFESLDLYKEVNSGFRQIESRDPLIIKNHGLGYILNYDLKEYIITDDTVRFYGSVLFEEMEADSRRERKRWEKNRVASYQGSQKHFFNSLFYSDLKDEGFLIFELRDNGYIEITENTEIIIKRISRNYFEVKLDYPVLIIYRGGIQKENRRLIDQSNKEIVSKMNEYFYLKSLVDKYEKYEKTVLISINKSAIIDLNGNYKSPINFVTHGYWSKERTAELLPIYFDNPDLAERK